jgi:AraC family transcriptional activator of pobA
MPDNIRKEIGYFNVFRLKPFVADNAQPVPYKRRNYYKIILVVGNSKVHYADKVVEVKTQQLEWI